MNQQLDKALEEFKQEVQKLDEYYDSISNTIKLIEKTLTDAKTFIPFSYTFLTKIDGMSQEAILSWEKHGKGFRLLFHIPYLEHEDKKPFLNQTIEVRMAYANKLSEFVMAYTHHLVSMEIR